MTPRLIVAGVVVLWRIEPSLAAIWLLCWALGWVYGKSLEQ
jgi:hypothetical protein